MRPVVAALSGLLVCTMPLKAEPLAELRARLERLQGQDDIAASVVVTHRSKDGGKVEKTAAPLTLDLRAGAQGLELTVPPPLLAQLEREAAARLADPDKGTPVADALREGSHSALVGMIAFAPALLRKLDGASVKEDRVDTLDGKPARLLVLALVPHLSAKDKDALKEFEASLKLWLDADGTPLACEETDHFKGRKFLISFEGGTNEKCRLQVVGTRLVAVSREREQSFNGFGEDQRGTSSLQLDLR